MTRTARRKGLTLLELILSTAIVAMLTLALYSALTAAFHARQSAQSQTVGVRSATVVLDLIEQDLKSVMPPTGTFNGPFMGYPAGGGSQSSQIDCYSMSHSFDTPDSPFAEGNRHILLMMGQDGTKPALIREVTRNLLAQNAVTPVDEVLATNVTSFSVQYYDGTTWTDSWDSTATSTLPLAIDITIEVQDKPDTDPTHTYKASRMIALPCAQLATGATS